MKKSRCFLKGHRFPIQIKDSKLIKIDKCVMCGKIADDRDKKHIKKTYNCN